MFQTFLEEETGVNGIVNTSKEGFSFIELGFTAIEDLLYEGEATSKS